MGRPIGASWPTTASGGQHHECRDRDKRVKTTTTNLTLTIVVDTAPSLCDVPPLVTATPCRAVVLGVVHATTGKVRVHCTAVACRVLSRLVRVVTRRSVGAVLPQAHAPVRQRPNHHDTLHYIVVCAWKRARGDWQTTTSATTLVCGIYWESRPKRHANRSCRCTQHCRTTTRDEPPSVTSAIHAATKHGVRRANHAGFAVTNRRDKRNTAPSCSRARRVKASTRRPGRRSLLGPNSHRARWHARTSHARTGASHSHTMHQQRQAEQQGVSRQARCDVTLVKCWSRVLGRVRKANQHFGGGWPSQGALHHTQAWQPLRGSAVHVYSLGICGLWT